MTKVVYNACFGGFSLSIEAAKWILEKNSTLLVGDGALSCGHEAALKESLEYAEQQESKLFRSIRCYPRIPRHHPLLVACVEALGKLANGSCADLRIEDIGNAVRYRIDEYDGRESVTANNVEEGWVYL